MDTNLQEVCTLQTRNSRYRKVYDVVNNEYQLQKELTLGNWSPMWVTIMRQVTAEVICQYEEKRGNTHTFVGVHPDNGRKTDLTTSLVSW